MTASGHETEFNRKEISLIFSSKTMHIQDVILIVTASAGRLDGRALLQKQMYFLGHRASTDFEHEPHYQGPFSRKVSHHLGILVEMGFLHAWRTAHAQAVTIFNERQHDFYQLDTENQVETSIMPLIEQEPDYPDWCSHIRQLHTDPVSGDLHIMSIAAKVHQIAVQRNHITPRSVDQIITDYKWSIPSETVDTVQTFLATHTQLKE